MTEAVTEQFVVYLDDDLHWIETHGGPYIPSKAREVREAMERHLANGNYREWSIPQDAEKVETVTKAELRELKEISLRADGGSDHCDACGEPLDDDGNCPTVTSMVDEVTEAFGDTEPIEASETFVAETDTLDEINDATSRFNSFLNEVRRDGGSRVRVALVEVGGGQDGE